MRLVAVELKQLLAARAEQLYTISTEGGYLLWAAQARIYRGWAQAMNGETDAGLAEMNAGIESYRLTGSGLMMAQMYLMLAEAYWRGGRPGKALAAVSKGLRHGSENQEHVYEPELHRLRGEIQVAQGANGAGEASFRRAIEVAQTQKARMLELRAALPMARMLRDTGRASAAMALLQPLFDWFQEGHQTPELVSCQELLAALKHNQADLAAETS